MIREEYMSRPSRRGWMVRAEDRGQKHTARRPRAHHSTAPASCSEWSTHAALTCPAVLSGTAYGQSTRSGITSECIASSLWTASIRPGVHVPAWQDTRPSRSQTPVPEIRLALPRTGLGRRTSPRPRGDRAPLDGRQASLPGVGDDDISNKTRAWPVRPHARPVRGVDHETRYHRVCSARRATYDVVCRGRFQQSFLNS